MTIEEAYRAGRVTHREMDFPTPMPSDFYTPRHFVMGGPLMSDADFYDIFNRGCAVSSAASVQNFGEEPAPVLTKLKIAVLTASVWFLKLFVP
jgi:hypothetical protein